ncbi:MAG: C40 family peptidase [Sterolibacterium sp.]|jgi:cell wall-associated NlpC family hydrolase|nr:C40 family peptidase [Sterolibacterium sp.]
MALLATLATLATFGLTSTPSHADQVTQDIMTIRQQLGGNSSFLERASNGANLAVDHALGLIGIRYRRGGSSPETGFDCSGFVDHVFKSIGAILPRTSREMSHSGEKVLKDDLQPGDLVFFNTMRRAFSHVGIYLGNHQFVHSPASGGEVRIDDMREKYWGKRYNGARRINAE